MAAEPWQCPACKAWMRPDVTEHHCDPDAGVTAKRPVPPAPASGGTVSQTGTYLVGERGPELVTAGGGNYDSTYLTNASTSGGFGGGTVVSMTSGTTYEVHQSGPLKVTVELDGHALWEEMQRRTREYNLRQGRPPRTA